MIVCKDNSYVEEKLTIGKKYNILGSKTAQGFLTTSKFFCILCDDGIQGEYSDNRFISVEEYREQQLNKIL